METTPTPIEVCTPRLSLCLAILSATLFLCGGFARAQDTPPTDDAPSVKPARTVKKATAVPIAKPKPTPTPAAKPSPVPAAKPSPTPKPTPTPAPKPTPTPIPKAAPVPKATPVASATPAKADPKKPAAASETPKPKRVKKVVTEKPAPVPAAPPVVNPAPAAPPVTNAAPAPETAPTVVSAAPSSLSAPGSAPSAPSGASPEIPAIPGYGPGEGLPTLPGGPGEGPQMELIPQGMTPLQPGLQFPNQSIIPSGPLVPQTAQQVQPKDLKYKISKFTLKYGPTKNSPHPKLPPIETLANVPITLGESKEPGGGYVAPGAGSRDVPIILSKFNTPETFSGDALQAIFYALVAQVNKKGISGVFAVQDADQINPANGDDLRKGSTELTLLVYASEVREVRTIVKPVAKWPFKSASTTINDVKYRRITAKSPLQPPPAVPTPKPADTKKPAVVIAAASAPASADPKKVAAAAPAAKPPAGAPPPTKHGSLLDRNLLQDYLTRINRFPGRRVDVAVTASGEEGGVILDYIVHAEYPPIFVFDQTSNTGAQASGSWRTRLGLEARQLAGYDDILDASFETSLSSATYSIFGSYQVTALFPDLLKFKVYGGYGRFLAEDVGQDNEQFLGKSATAGLLGIYTPFYFKGFPLDIIVGAEFKHVDIANIGNGGSRGVTDFLLPIFGLATDRTTDTFSAFGSVQVEPNLPGIAGTDETELKNMGRFNVSTDFVIAKYSFGGSIFLEPILFKGTWKQLEESDEEARKPLWKKVTLAHELAMLIHGQYTFGDKRLVPQFEDVLGGFASVRGYPEAFTSGDDSFVANLEYRFHLPRVLKPADTDRLNSLNPPPTPKFTVRPQTILSRPDLDFILRGFFDFGYVKNNDIFEATEADRTLMSVGVGAETQISRYLNLRIDVGFPLISIKDKTSRPVEAGSPRISFVGVISY